MAMTETASSIRLLPAGELEPRRAHIPYGRATRWQPPGEADGPQPVVSVFVSQRAFVRFSAHAGSDLDNEVGGWLVGKWRSDRQSGQQFIVVENILQAPHTRHGSAYLTFTQDSQVALHQAFEERFPGKDLVGWYHTHPRMGVFLSEYDTWLHRNFFPEHYQVALVIEPYSAVGGFFIRQAGDGSLDPRRYYGFYELHNRKRRSVVHWRNLSPGAEAISGG
jgi:proteasome lid subunit RPN8/RPN11